MSYKGHQHASPGHISGQQAAVHLWVCQAGWFTTCLHMHIQLCRGVDLSTARSSAVLLDGIKQPVEDTPAAPPNVTYKDLFIRFILLGWIAFGGPSAHIALFQKASTSTVTCHCSQQPPHSSDAVICGEGVMHFCNCLNMPTQPCLCVCPSWRRDWGADLCGEAEMDVCICLSGAAGPVPVPPWAHQHAGVLRAGSGSEGRPGRPPHRYWQNPLPLCFVRG